MEKKNTNDLFVLLSSLFRKWHRVVKFSSCDTFLNELRSCFSRTHLSKFWKLQNCWGLSPPPPCCHFTKYGFKEVFILVNTSFLANLTFLPNYATSVTASWFFVASELFYRTNILFNLKIFFQVQNSWYGNQDRTLWDFEAAWWGKPTLMIFS